MTQISWKTFTISNVVVNIVRNRNEENTVRINKEYLHHSLSYLALFQYLWSAFVGVAM